MICTCETSKSLYVGLARTVPPTNTNFQLTVLLTRHQEDLYEDLAVQSFEVYHHFAGVTVYSVARKLCRSDKIS